MIMINDQLKRSVLIRELPKRTAALILAGGKGSRLKELTETRAKPAVHFGGKFRIIDFSLSNCMNSGIRRIGVLTQYHSHSLVQHIQRGWSFLNEEMNEFIDLLPAQQKWDHDDWYKGTADAIYQNLDIVKRYGADFILVLAGDHIYKMDYSQLLLDHVEKGALCTIGCIEVPRAEAGQFGIMEIDDQERIINFTEKPVNPPGMINNSEVSLASMGIYVFNSDYLYELLEKNSADMQSEHDFGKDIIPDIVAKGRAWAHPFSRSCVVSDPKAQVYWRDVGTLDAYWQTNLDLASIMPELDIYDRNWPIRTYMEPLPPAKFVQDNEGSHGMTMNSLIGAGAIVTGSIISNSVLFPRVRVDSFCTIESSVLLPDVYVGRHSRLRRCIVDRACRIPDGLVIGENIDEDRKNFSCSESGVVLVTRKMLDKLET